MNNIITFIKAKLKNLYLAKYKFGLYDNSATLSLPTIISGAQNIYINKNVKIGSDSILYATHAKIIIGPYFISARGLRIITGQHERRIGKFCSTITDKNKDLSKNLDKDVVIEHDVWAGMNVIILGGVTIGRGATLAAGSIITKSVPPYSIVGGIPAKFIKFYWTIDEIMQHELALYSEEERYTKAQLEEIFKEEKYINQK